MNEPTVPTRSPSPPPNAPLDSPTTEVQLGKSSLLPWLLLVAGGIGLAALFMTGMLRLPPRGDTAAEKNQWLQELAEHNDEFGKFLEDTRRQTDWESAERMLNQLTTTLGRLSQEHKTLNQEFDRLSQTAAGSGIAGQPELVAQFTAIRTHERPSAAELDNYAVVIPKYQAVCQRALADRTIVFDPQQSFGVDLRVMLKQMEGQLQQVQADNHALAALVASAGTGPKSDMQLSAAAEELAAAQSRQFAARLAAEKEQLRQEAEERIRAIELESERARLEAEARLRAAAAQSQVDAAVQQADDAEQALAVEQARRERLARFEKQLPRVRSLLSPMISSGTMQLDANGNWYEDDSGPLSLTVLQPLCAAGLEQSGNMQMMNLFSAPMGRNDRPRGSWPAWGSEGLPEMRRAQQFIVDYGDLLVEQKLLRP